MYYQNCFTVETPPIIGKVVFYLEKQIALVAVGGIGSVCGFVIATVML